MNLKFDKTAVVFSFVTSSDEEASFDKFVDFHSVFDAKFLKSCVLMKTVDFSSKVDFAAFAFQELDYVHEDDKETASDFINKVIAETDVKSYDVVILNVASEQDYFVVVLNK